MCGLAGILHFDQQPVDPVRLAAMLAQVRHRGPDDQGTWIEGGCGLAHSRLAVIDPAHGGQPMSDTDAGGDAGLRVIFNGEIYNHQALRRELIGLGHRFHSDHSDTEVLVYGYRQWGRDLPRRLEGMFAFAIFDAHQRTLYLARDRHGKKPLYYHHTPRSVHFGSLPATVLAGLPDPAALAVDQQALATYLTLGYTLETTLLEGLVALEPGHDLLVACDGRMDRRPCASIPDAPAPDALPPGEEELEALLRQAVARRLEADVPFGCFLSGGLDSSLVAALAQQQRQVMGAAPLATFTMGMEQADLDESAHAREVARWIGATHTPLTAQPDQALDDLETLMRHSGQPLADSSLLATHWLCRAAREHVTVALSGDGGDELFGGYDRYRALHLLKRMGPAIALLPPMPWLTQHRGVARFNRLRQAARRGRGAGGYRSMVEIFTPGQLARLGFTCGHHWTADPTMLPAWPAAADERDAAMHWDRAHYLACDLLRKVDRASMAVALEVRCPLLDSFLVERVGVLPATVRMQGNRAKALLRNVAARHLPPSLLKRRKQGFAIPLSRWLRGPWREAVRAHLGSNTLGKLGLDEKYIATLVREHMDGQCDHGHRLFSLLQLALWQQWRENIQSSPGERR